MHTIDDIKFPPSFTPPITVIAAEYIQLPNNVIIKEGDILELEHDGIHAIVRYKGKEYKF